MRSASTWLVPLAFSGPFWVFKRLKKLNLLERDRDAGKRRICERVFGLMELWDDPDFRPDCRFRACDPGFQRVWLKDSGYASADSMTRERICLLSVNSLKPPTHPNESVE